MQSLRSPSAVVSKAGSFKPSSTGRRAFVIRAAKKQEGKEKLDGGGFIGKDNSGRGNVFPTSSKAFYSSPTSAAVASSGLGGLQGAAVVAAAIGVVVLATIGVAGQGPKEDGLSQLNSSYDGESLSAIADRIAESL